MPHEPPADPGERVKRLRVRLGLTQTALAQVLGVSFATVNRWENRQAQPSALAWRRLRLLEAGGVQALEEASRSSRPADAQRPPGDTAGGRVELDFGASPDVVRVVAEAERLAHGHQFNPAFATETSLIDPLPHQRIAVYQRMLPQARLRFLLADDAGAGKTIMAGLYVREMLGRGLLRRVLVVPPAGLVGNWERELRTLFRLPFRILRGADARSANPFEGDGSDLVIVSIDTLAGERMRRRLGAPGVEPYDLVVIDEAHKLSADRDPDGTLRKRNRYKLAEALVGAPSADKGWRLPWGCRHVLLLTATPHMGKDFPYYCLWRLLEPEVLSTPEAFEHLPAEERGRRFIRRVKEEMVDLRGERIYPERISDTLGYELSQGPVSEQALYDRTTRYMRHHYNRAKVLNRSAARLAMSVFQRRLASSTHALSRSLERRVGRIDGYLEDLRSGRLDVAALAAAQRRLEGAGDPFDDATADEDEGQDGREGNEAAEDQLLAGVIATSLGELQAEREEVIRLVDLADKLLSDESREDSKFERLRELLRDPRFRDEKVIVFTEHRDTLEFLLGRLEALGFAGRVASIHGGMDFVEREEQVEAFRLPAAEGGAQYLVATDAAGEGINLQFCWLMVNYDVPWNPARLEQRMGRIHRYGQKHDPVVIVNLVAPQTREGRVLKTLLDKLEVIRKRLRSDKVFDVVGRLFEGVSLRAYMEQALTDEGADEAATGLAGRLTEGQVRAQQERERRLYGEGGEVQACLAVERERIDREVACRLLPGYVARFLEWAAPLLGLAIEGDLDRRFSLRPTRPGAFDALGPVLEEYPAAQRRRLTVHRPSDSGEVVFLHPGERVFERFRALVLGQLGREARRGAVFVDPGAANPYLLHVARVTLLRRADPAFPELAREEVLERRLVVLRQNAGIEECPPEHLLLLRGGDGLPGTASALAATSTRALDAAQAWLTERVATTLAGERRAALQEALSGRIDLLRRGYHYREAELAGTRSEASRAAREGDSAASARLATIKEAQRRLVQRRKAALAAEGRRHELVEAEAPAFVAHALVVPSSDPEDKKRYDAAVEAVAMQVSVAHETALGATIEDVHTPALARAAGLPDWPGFDLRSHRPDGRVLNIEVKGRSGQGEVELSENEWAKACSLREAYWLYVVYDCGTARPRPPLRVSDPFGKLLVRARGGVLVKPAEILAAAETAP